MAKMGMIFPFEQPQNMDFDSLNFKQLESIFSLSLALPLKIAILAKNGSLLQGAINSTALYTV